MLLKMLNLFRGHDLDDLLAYKTPKVVVVKDRLLGGLRMAGMIGVAVYFVVFRIIFEKGYYLREETHAIVETSLRAPQLGLAPMDGLGYCRTNSTGESQIALPCTTGPDGWVTAPSTGSDTLFVATRLKDVSNGRGDNTRSFVQDPESYTFGISFTLQALKMYHETGDAKFSRSTEEVQTALMGLDGQEMTGAVQRIGRRDIIKVQTLLEAAGVDSLEGTFLNTGAYESFRYAGCVLVLSVNCLMAGSGSVDRCEYSVWRMEGSEAKMVMATGVDPSTSQVQERHGIKIVVSTVSEMGIFSWYALMFSWLAAAATFGIISKVVEFLMIYCMPHRAVYRLLKFEQTIDFSDFRDGNPETVAAVKFLEDEGMRRRAKISLHEPPAVVYAKTWKDCEEKISAADVAEADADRPSVQELKDSVSGVLARQQELSVSMGSVDDTLLQMQQEATIDRVAIAQSRIAWERRCEEAEAYLQSSEQLKTEMEQLTSESKRHVLECEVSSKAELSELREICAQQSGQLQKLKMQHAEASMNRQRELQCVLLELRKTQGMMLEDASKRGTPTGHPGSPCSLSLVNSKASASMVQPASLLKIPTQSRPEVPQRSRLLGLLPGLPGQTHSIQHFSSQ
ncbi:unnamed protein product [Polarella glacialis]|uniref:Uncharacterized protein n=1 Tax=Polarella glacialis TaxID=89957 RepID=A0A813FN22_POLGL|nr:unnamed protein product [Polarella glacialis]